MKDKIRIASGQGFWGDWLQAPLMQVTKGPIDYMMMDYLAEVTMSIMQKQKLKNPNLGYAKDLVETCEQILPHLVKNNIKLITNGGGVNPLAARDAVFKVAEKLGIKNLRIGVVLGDDILSQVDGFLERGIELKNMETGKSAKEIRSQLLSANVYFGAFPVVEALRQGAQIVITGRTTDTGLTLAPMIHEFGWGESDWNKLAAGTIAGHINECGAQSTGGNFLGGWEKVPNMHRIGFPIVEAYPDGEFVMTKHAGTGGLVSRATVAEQCLYEIGDPREYITPDCVADFTTIHLKEEKKNRVRVFGIEGKPATPFYKVSMSYADGYVAFGSLTYAWPDALKKAQAADKVLRLRLKDLGLSFDEIRTEFIGYNACHGPLADKIIPNEVMLRIGVRGHDYAAIERFGKEIAPLILTGPPTVTGFAGGRPKPSEVVAYWPALIPKTEVMPEVVVEER
ncbi:MAG TPA: acyclic terpene utilization AtuA family protein [Candidatus Kapabacteria bacterium]|nr:acyclic terpene utilization AtuA family protein [Candidatus Kapabacteria bacterium]